jgi:hypothetical protein
MSLDMVLYECMGYPFSSTISDCGNKCVWRGRIFALWREGFRLLEQAVVIDPVKYNEVARKCSRSR